MSSENKALVQRWFDEVWNNRDANAIDEMLDQDCKVHGFGPDPLNHAAFKEFHQTYSAAFPDVHLTVREMVAEGDVVAARWEGAGTHKGVLMGFNPTFKTAKFSGMVFSRIRNGKIVEGWNMFNELDTLTLVGAVVPAQPMPRG